MKIEMAAVGDQKLGTAALTQLAQLWKSVPRGSPKPRARKPLVARLVPLVGPQQGRYWVCRIQ